MATKKLDKVEIAGAVASVAALLLVFWLLKNPSPKQGQGPFSTVLAVPSGAQPITQSTEPTVTLPAYDNQPATPATYNIGGTTVTSDFCSSCGG